MSVRSSTRCVRLDRPAPFKPDDPPLLLPRVDDENERVVEPVVQALTGRVGESESEMEPSFCKRERGDLEAHRALALIAVPAELTQVDCLAGDERPHVVSELELESRREDSVPCRDAYPDGERLAREELEPLAPL